MTTPNLQIEGGNFQDLSGNVLANGYLLFELSHDGEVSSVPAQIVAGLKVKVNLNSSGSIPSSPAVLIWSNDAIAPAGSYYIVRAFKSDGTDAWADFQYWILASSPDPLDVGTIIPLNPPGFTATGVSGLTLETNEVLNGSQTLLDLHAGTGITLTDNGTGRVTVASSGGGVSGSGTTGTIPVWTSSTALGNSGFTDNGAGTVNYVSGLSLTASGFVRIAATGTIGSTGNDVTFTAASDTGAGGKGGSIGLKPGSGNGFGVDTSGVVYIENGAGATAFYLSNLNFSDLAAPLPLPGSASNRKKAMIICNDAMGPQNGATFGSIAAGGGTGAILAYDGTNWRVIG